MSKYREIIKSPTTKEQNKETDLHIVWVRISAFLDLKSKNTQTTYLGVINEWCEFLGVIPGTYAAAQALLAAIDLHAIAYRKWLERRPGQKPRYIKTVKERSPEIANQFHSTNDGLQNTQTNSTIAKKFAALRRIYRMLISSNLGIYNNPFDPDRVPAPSSRSGQKRPTEMIQFCLVKDIINLPDQTTLKGLRDKTALALLFGGGLRRSEVVNLKLCDVKSTPQGTVYVHLRATKNKKDAEQTIPEWAAKPLLELYQQRKEEAANDGDPLFISYRGPCAKKGQKQQMTANGLYRIFKYYCQLAGAGSFVTPHSARATAITKLLSDGVGHREVQEFSRHSSIQMVEVYDKRRYGIEENPAKKLNF